jgi:predicted dienelactone hydrolase
MKLFAALLGLMYLAGSSALAGECAGFSKLEIAATASRRALEVAVWYPTRVSPMCSPTGDNPVFSVAPVAVDAPMEQGRHPLVILSHGYGGNNGNQGWLAVALTRQGYIVVAPNHPGTTTADLRPDVAAQLWERPRDISHLVDFMSRSPRWAPVISSEKIAVIGHSLGGWTALELAGGRLDPARMEQDCLRHGELAACKVYTRVEKNDAVSRAALGQSLRDPRVMGVISLDLGLARGFDPASLANIQVPVLVIAAGSPSAEMPAELESRVLLERLPASRRSALEIPDATHFSFLPVCLPGAARLLESAQPGDGALCREGGGRPREEIHQQVADAVSAFLRRLFH